MILGLAGGRPGAAAAIVADGQVVAAAAEERFTRQSGDPNFPRFAIEFCLDRVGLEAHELEAIAWHEDPQARFSRVLTDSLAGFPAALPQFVREMQHWMGDGLWVRNRISRQLDVHPDAIHFVPSHRAMAAHALAATKLDEAAVLVAEDAEWACTTLATARQGEAFEHEVHLRRSWPHSLGSVRSAFATYLGFRAEDAVADLQHLARFGAPVYAGRVGQMVPEHEEGYAVERRFFRLGERRPFTAELTDLLGPPRDHRRALPFASGREVGPEDQRYADIAASLQEILGQRLVALVQRLRACTDAEDLVLTGLVATDASLVGRVRDEGPFGRVHVPLETGAPGGAVGAAVALAGRATLPSPYLGRRYDELRDVEMMRGADPTWWQRFRRRGCRSVRGAALRVEHAQSVEALLPLCVAQLERGGVLGWAQGAFAWGPRSLGSRSVVVDPTVPGAEERLRERVTGTPALRPLPRVRRGDSPALDPLLEALEQRTGRSELVELGMAEEGFPLAASPADALLLFMRTELDALVFNRMYVAKEWP